MMLREVAVHRFIAGQRQSDAGRDQAVRLFVEFSLITVNATCPGLMCFNPSLREINLQLGGKIDESARFDTRQCRMRRASSNWKAAHDVYRRLWSRRFS